MPGTMKIFFLIFAALILLAQIFPARSALLRRVSCSKMEGRCEAECLTFEERLGGCRAELTPFCCKKKKEKIKVTHQLQE
ncbi:beta-defensin 107A-like [Tupaia chinensis]|uniref:beta-defensin 107A-like n=1 Tax=Tupaia chinensis TaxID=246437 RepID=UPI0003C8E335|nr:beta-defensin 107A-like [Tupaia chinensis]